jgi:hypothetical protein
MKKTLCLIRFGTQLDNEVSLTLGLLSCEPIEYAMQAEGVVITIFKTTVDISKCRSKLLLHKHNFVLLDITNDANNTQIAGFGLKAVEMLEKSQLKLTPDEKEAYLLKKIKDNGIESLSKQEHEFLQSRMEVKH